jgi:hypothetical protein
MIKTLILSLVAFFALSLASPLALAASETDPAEDPSPTYYVPKPEFLPGPSGTEQTGRSVQDYVLNTTVPRTINIIAGVFGILAFLGIMVSAIKMLTAFGNEDDVTSAKTTLRYSITGFAVIIFAYAIVSIVVSIALPAGEESPPEDQTQTWTEWIIPPVYAEKSTIDTLLPSQSEFIADPERGVSVPEGDILNEVLPAVVSNMFYFVGFLIFIGFVYGGILLVIGRGNEEEIGKAKTLVTYSAIALAIMSGGYAIIYGLASLDLTNDSSTDEDNVYTEATQEQL